MANQITIDIGAAANDGTGDPLRTAFNYVNNNFSNVWNTGLPTSNVQFLDNKILTVNTNANLVLAPNGIGKVASNVDIVPNTANVFALGSSTRRWNTVYGQYLDLSHNATIGGNLVVTGNLSAGNISYTSNVFVGDLEGSVFDGASSIVLDVIDSSIYVDNYYYANGTPVSFGGGNGTPAGSNTQIQFNNNGAFGAQTGFNFNTATNNLVVPGNILNTTTATANLGGALFPWNYLFTSNISASNTILTLGNIVGGNISTTGNISASNVFVVNTITSTDCYITTGTFSGADETGDNSLFIGHPTFTTLGTDIMAQFTGNVVNYAQINFQNYSNANTASGDYIITADNGNDFTHFLDMGMTSSTWDGSQTNVLDGLSPNNGYLYVQDGNLTLGVRNGSTSYTWKFDNSGFFTAPGTVKTGVFVTGNIPSASAAGAGARAFVTDADIGTWGNLYVGGAANAMPVWSDGTNWYIG